MMPHYPGANLAFLTSLQRGKRMGVRHKGTLGGTGITGATGSPMTYRSLIAFQMQLIAIMFANGSPNHGCPKELDQRSLRR